MKENTDPASVGEKLLATLLKNRSRGRSRTSGKVDMSDHRRSCLPQLDEDIASKFDLTSELYKSVGAYIFRYDVGQAYIHFVIVTKLNAKELDVNGSFEIFASFLLTEIEEDAIVFFNNTKYLDEVISLKETVMGLTLLHVASSMGKVQSLVSLLCATQL